MKKNKTILEKIGVNDKIVKKWKREGLKIIYPTRARTHFLRSDDGEIAIENADKFVPPLNKEETRLYKKYPEKFRKDFLKNVRFYIKFCNFIFKLQKQIENLKTGEKIIALLSMLYLFQRAMDYHYYHWDRYLVYQDYPSTPIGYWWKKLRGSYIKVSRERVLKNKPPEDFLKLLSEDKKVLRKFEENLSKKDFLRLKQTLKAIKIFEDAQQKEAEVITDSRRKEDIFKRTAFPMWNKFCEEIRKHPESIKKRGMPKIRKILSLHPIIAIRRIMPPRVLRYFDNEVFNQFEKEIKRWIK